MNDFQKPEPSPVLYLDEDRSTFRSVLEIFPDAIRENFQVLKKLANCEIMPVLKSDAYGLGLECVYHALEPLHPGWIGVANPREGERLRRLGYRGRVLILGGFLEEETPLLAQWELTPAVYNTEHVRWLSAYFSGEHPCPVHIKIDTGMGRLGLLKEELVSFLSHLKGAHWIQVEGVFSNLACADQSSSQHTQHQLNIFEHIVELVRTHGYPIRYRHIANSAGILLWNISQYEIARPGLSLYGWVPDGASIKLHPALRWWARILQIRYLPAGSTIGYGATYTLKKDSWIAVIGIGYYDGYDRRFSNKAHVLDSRGNSLRVLGRISMDLTAVELNESALPQVGEPVLLLGSWQDKEITLDQLANWAQTTPHEILCRIGPRVARRLTSERESYWPMWKQIHTFWG